MIGNVGDTRCKQNRVRVITRKQCKHNCKYWDRLNNKCKLGY